MAAASQSDAAAHHRGPGQRRPMCAVCTKPLRVCLCGRLRSPPVETAIGVTVLQHAMEVHHPLNSTRVARLGLRNLAVAQVTDVNHRARFVLTTLGAGAGAEAPDLGGERAGAVAACSGNLDHPDGPGDNLVRRGGEILDFAMFRDWTSGESDGKGCAECILDKTAPTAYGDLDEEGASLGASSECLNLGDGHEEMFCDLSADFDSVKCGLNSGENIGFQGTECDGQAVDFEKPCSAKNWRGNSVVTAFNGESNHRSQTRVTCEANGDLAHSVASSGSDVNVIFHNGIGNPKLADGSADFGQDWTMKNMDKCTIAYTEKELRIDIERGVKPKIRWLSRGLLGQAAVSDGFVVKKIQTKKSKHTGEVTEFEEFSITIPPKSALLFPCQRAISIDSSGCQVQHLIVLDGTWAKAQRMYHENPWLQLLPHVKLEADRVSLYSEVRHEPRPGCLSTIESIVVAMRKLGEDSKGLDDLLDVFESMIADQRRCKDENWKQKQKS
ncbi:hypothetical protein ACP4OV_007577 [Aristida adscensionis]